MLQLMIIRILIGKRLRSKVKPYRKNCEGYFFKDGNVMALDNGSYIEFPGGGVDDGETSEESLIREVLEETGYKVSGLKEIKMIRFDWDENWAKTDKQKERLKYFRGEEMHFFIGKIIDKVGGGEWGKDVWMDVDYVIKRIKEIGWSEDMDEYRRVQLKILSSSN